MTAPHPLPRRRFDDDEFDGSPRPITSKTKKRDVGGVCNPPQTMDAIILPKGKGGGGSRHQNTSFGSTATPTKTRQTQPKGRAARQKERRELKGGKKGGKR